MANEQQASGAIQRAKVGRFQISVWQVSRRLKARGDFDVEREFTCLRACVRYSRFNHRLNEWENQNIWFDSEELRDLAQALDSLSASGAVNGSAAQVAACPEPRLRG